MKTFSLKALSILGVAIFLAGCGRGGGGGDQAKGGGKPAGQPVAAEGTPVRVAPAVSGTVRRMVPVTGSVAALQSIDLAPKITGRVLQVAGREGAVVRRGQIVVHQETEDLRTQVQQAEANLRSAQARVAQTETQYRVQTRNSIGEVENMRQQLRQAEAALALARRPQRTQEIAVAENAVRQAQANYDRAAADQKRYAGLVREGAAAQSVLDQYVTQARVSRAALDSARQQLEIARTGGRQENIRTAEANVARARLGVGSARTNLQQQNVWRNDIRAARAAVAQARAALAFARQQIANASIRSPIDGVIADRLTEPGQLAAPGAAVLRLVALDNVFFEAQVPETDIRSVRAGMNVGVRIDALRGRNFTGKVAKVYPTASTQSRSFTVRIVLPNGNGLLRPGMFARGDVVAERREGIIVSKDALLSREGKTLVFVANANGKAELRNVKVGIQTEETAEIRSGVQEGDRVIVTGQDALQNDGVIRIQGQEGGQQAAMR